MIGIVAKLIGTGLALWVTSRIYTDISFGSRASIVTVLVVAAIFGVVNAFLKPVLKTLSFPLTMMTLGLFGVVINGVLLLLVAWIATELGRHFSVGGFPPNLGSNAFLAAIIGGVVLSVVSALIDMLPFVKTSR